MLSRDEILKKYHNKLNNGDYEKDFEHERKLMIGNGPKVDLSPEGIEKKVKNYKQTLDELATIWPEEFGDDPVLPNLCPDQVIGSLDEEEEIYDCSICPIKGTCTCTTDEVPAKLRDYFCKSERETYFQRTGEEVQRVRTNVKKSNNIH